MIDDGDCDDDDDYTVWCLVGTGGMDPYDSPLRVRYSSPYNPFPHPY